MDLSISILALTMSATLGLSLLVLLRDYSSRVGQSFFVMAFFINAWAFSDYITSNATDLKLNRLFNRLAFLFAFQALVWASIFTNIFLNSVYKSKRQYLFVNIFVIAIVSVLSLFPIIAGNVYREKGSLVFTFGSLLWEYILILIFYLVLVVRNFYLSFKHGNGRQKNQTRVMILGFSIGILLGIFANALIPLFTSSWKTASLGPALVSLFIVGSVSYAIVKHRLFDIRSFVVRAVAYILTLTCITLIYIGPTVLVTNYLLHNHLRTINLAILVVITIVVAFLFHPLKKYFDTVTSKIFYRDYYDPQTLLDRLGDVVVGSVEVDRVIKYSLDLIEQSIKPRFVRYGLVVRSNETEKELLSKLFEAHKGIIVTDEIFQSSSKGLYELLSQEDIALSVRLRTKKENIGFIFMGYKVSGSIYTKTDQRVLDVAADEIAISLQNAFRFEEIKNFNKTLEQKIEDATGELRKANSRLKILDETKDDFISMASHQLRTPLSIIKGYVNMVVNGDAGKVNKQQKDFLDQALVSSKSMVNLVTELLNVSRITSGKFSIDVSPVNLADIVDSEVKQLANMAVEKKIDLTFQKPQGFPILLLDEDKTKQVITNFIDNAIHYSKNRGAKINVQLSYNGYIVFKVIDNGIGVPSSEKERLFTKFYRAKNAKEARPDGTGVGIYLAKVVITKQGGDLIFESKEGVGSTFGFRFKKDKIINNEAKAK